MERVATMESAAERKNRLRRERRLAAAKEKARSRARQAAGAKADYRDSQARVAAGSKVDNRKSRGRTAAGTKADNRTSRGRTAARAKADNRTSRGRTAAGRKADYRESQARVAARSKVANFQNLSQAEKDARVEKKIIARNALTPNNKPNKNKPNKKKPAKPASSADPNKSADSTNATNPTNNPVGSSRKPFAPARESYDSALRERVESRPHFDEKAGSRDPMRPWSGLGEPMKKWAEMWGPMQTEVECRRCQNCGSAWFHTSNTRLRELTTWVEFGDAENGCCDKCQTPLGISLWSSARLPPTPKELLELTPLEERCISIIQPIVSVFTYGKGGASYQGHCSSMRASVSSWCKTLPRDPKSIGFVMVRRRTSGAMGGSARPPFRVNVPRMIRALKKLKELQQGIPNSYADINIGNLDLYPTSDPEGNAQPEFAETEAAEDADVNKLIGFELWEMWIQSGLPLSSKMREAISHRTESSSWDAVRAEIAARADSLFDQDDDEDEKSDKLMGECRRYPAFPVRWLLQLLPAEPPRKPAQHDDFGPEEDGPPQLLLEILQELNVATAANIKDPDAADHDFGQENAREDEEQARREKDEVIDGLLGNGNQKKETNPDAEKKLNSAILDKFPWLRVDPPELQEAVSEDTPGYIRCAFPKIFAHGKACPTERPKTIPFGHWCLHLMQSSTEAAKHATFRYFCYNTQLRQDAFSSKTSWLLKGTADRAPDHDDLGRATKKQLQKGVYRATAHIPGTVGSKETIRRQMEAMHHQVDEEHDQIPPWFSTCSSVTFHEHVLETWIRRWLECVDGGDAARKHPQGPDARRALANENPLIAALFGAVRLELLWQFSTMLTRMQSDPDATGSFDSIATFEWSKGAGMIHTHGFHWDPASVRVDTCLDHLDGATEDELIRGRMKALQELLDYAVPRLTEFHPHVTDEEFDRPSKQLEENPCDIDHTKYIAILNGDQKEQLDYAGLLLEQVQFHDNHYPSANGPPAAHQPCAKLHPKTGICFCGKKYPKQKVSQPSVQKGDRDYLEINCVRNNAFVNSLRPARLLAAKSNVDDQLMTTMDALIKYATKYATKENGDEIGLSAFDAAMKRAKDAGKGTHSGLHKFFNQCISCSSLISAAEVCHHFLGLPEFLCTRDFQTASLDPRSRVIDPSKLLDPDNEDGEQKDYLKQTRYEKYCARHSFVAWHGGHNVHPVNGHISNAAEFLRDLRGATFYEFLRFYQTRWSSEQKTFQAGYVTGAPKVLLLTPYLSFYRTTDTAKWRLHLRLALRTYINIDSKPDISDATMRTMPLQELEDKMVMYLGEMPQEIQKRWKLAREREKRDEARRNRAEAAAEKDAEPKPPKKDQRHPEPEENPEDDEKDLSTQDEKTHRNIEAKLRGVTKKNLEHAIGALFLLRPGTTRQRLIQRGIEFAAWLSEKVKPIWPTADLLRGVLSLLGQPKIGNKDALIERYCVLFSDKEEDIAAALARRAKAGASRVDRMIQELSSKGKNPFEDGRGQDFYDGIEKHVLAECQAVRSAKKIVDAVSATNEGYTPEISLGQITHILDASLEEKKARRARPSGSAKQNLDPTQSAMPKLIQTLRANNEGNQPGSKKGILRGILTGLAGAGKSAVCHEFDDVSGEIYTTIFSAPTGVAANNLACLGAQTLHRLLLLHQKELTETQLEELAEQWRDIQLLVVDEFSMVGRKTFAKMSDRLDEVVRHILRQQDPDGHLPPDDATLFPYGFGNLHVLLVGDLGQAPPVKDTPLFDRKEQTSARSFDHAANNRGKELFDHFLDDGNGEVITACIRLRRTYRQKGTSEAEIRYKNSCIRLRDAAITPDDYSFWEELSAPERAEEKWTEAAVHIVGDNERCGAFNGRKLASLGTVHRFRAYYSDDRAREKRLEAFEHLSSTTHLAVGQKVMLTTNTLLKPVVKLGLSNGARGEVRGISYAKTAGGSSRLQYVYVDFPTYSGKPFFEDAPKVVPVPLIEATARSFTMIGVPLRSAFALTVHKSQGLTIPEGTVVDWGGSMDLATKPGLPFVGSTRCTTVTRMAMMNLPPFLKFLQARDTPAFRNRQAVEKRLDELHSQTMKKVYGAESEEFELHRRQILSNNDANDEGTIALLKEVEEQLSRPGVLPIPTQTLEQVRALTGKKDVCWKDLKKAFENRGGSKGVVTKLGGKQSKKGSKKPPKKSTLRHQLFEGFLEKEFEDAKATGDEDGGGSGEGPIGDEIRDRGLVLADVAGDGHCLYHALRCAIGEQAGTNAAAALLQEQYALDDASMAGAVGLLRKVVVDNAAEVLEGLGVEQVNSCAEAALDGLAQWDPPRGKTACPGTAWGTEDTLYVLTVTLGIRTTMFEYETRKVFTYAANEDPELPHVFIARTGNHFQFLRDAGAVPRDAPPRKRAKLDA